MIDGETVALDHNGVPNFSALQAALSDGKTDDLIFFAFDLLFADGFDLRRLPLIDRKARLEKLLEGRSRKKSNQIRYVEHFGGDGDSVLQSARKLELEGVVSHSSSKLTEGLLQPFPAFSIPYLTIIARCQQRARPLSTSGHVQQFLCQRR